MTSPSPSRLLLSPVVVFLLLLSSSRLATSESARACSLVAFPFVYALESRCPSSISPSPPLKVDGNFVDRLLTSKHQQGFTSVLFHASWCPFSNSILPIFYALSTMFPQISHASVEQCSTLPSLFSKYGIHSFPSIVLVNETSRIRYYGPKTLQSLIQFYEANTGIQPMQSLGLNLPDSVHTSGNSIMQLSSLMSLKEMTSSEPYLVFSVLFICLKAVLIVLPGLLSRLKGLWLSYVPRLKLKIFGETAQIWGRIVQMVDVRRIWMKMRLSKVRSFHDRARSAQVWASSLASVSLGESSSARSSS
ncbi:hypothetical protein MLD38_004563 [Melastoma candidum]|uniref:Uncharacterized protein n=1 Tax=Melastoma candidum TaxID=119954 RepID=A0ACB9SEN5_9MYRT|nr:hypothetical protein MLD38_004563 [Melastoma candidum]